MSFYCFSLWEKAALHFWCILKIILHRKTANKLLISHYTLLRACILSSYVCDHTASPRISANADFSTTLKCLASGKKSIEQLCPSTPRQNSALELLLFCYFRILLVYHHALYLWNVNFTMCARSLSYPPPEGSLPNKTVLTRIISVVNVKPSLPKLCSSMS